jgi:hypothetical protein
LKTYPKFIPTVLIFFKNIWHNIRIITSLKSRYDISIFDFLKFLYFYQKSLIALQLERKLLRFYFVKPLRQYRFTNVSNLPRNIFDFTLHYLPGLKNKTKVPYYKIKDPLFTGVYSALDRIAISINLVFILNIN